MPDPKITTILKFVEFDFHMTSLDFPGGSDRKESACSAGDLGSVPGWGRFPGGEHGNLFRYSYLENPHGQRSLADYSPCGLKESDMTERLTHTLHIS